MLPDKIKEKISEIGTDFNENKLESINILKGFKALKLTEGFSEFKHLKRSGYSFQLVLSAMIYAVTMGRKTAVSSLPLLKEKGITMGKDVLYRLKNNVGIDWWKILWQTACKFIGITKGENEGEHKVRCLIFDDTLLEKTGKMIEKIGKVYDHVTNTFKLGYKLLLGLYWDGKSMILLDFSLSREKGKRAEKPWGMSRKELRRQYGKKRLKELSGREREKELDKDKSKIEMMLEIFYRAVLYHIPIDYVLCDSWFTCQALITAVRSKHIHLIGMYKIVKAKFRYRGKLMNYRQINNSIDETTRCRKMRLHYKRSESFKERLCGLFLELLREICEALEKDIDELFELIMNCPRTAELVSKMLAPPLQDAV